MSRLPRAKALHPAQWTIRVRLTLLYGGLVALAGAALLLVVYEVVDQATAPPDIAPATVAGWRDPDPAVDPNGTKYAWYLQMRDYSSGIRRTVLYDLSRYGLLALVVFALAGLLIGWIVAGRTLRPITRITEIARHAGERNLHERIALTGPRDELRELADTFDDMLGRLDAAFAGQSRFIANASHELKTPLAVNRTLVEVAMARPAAPAQLIDLGETLLTVNARHERLIDGLLTLARSDQTVAEPVLVDLADVLDRAADGVRAEALRAGVRVEARAGDASTQGDPALLERLALNLLQNAVRYNSGDGEGWVTAVTGRRQEGVFLTVENSGPRFERHEVPPLFEPFRRARERTGSAQGTGLGLSIVRSVARMHGGEATAVPRPEGGLTVEVVLPTHRAYRIARSLSS